MVRIDGIIEWWPPSLQAALPERAEVFVTVEETPQWLPATQPLP
ncbi:MAG: hypothetical protein OXH07_13585 [Chloroflexi bacterium]|nr:hypothetical protein [Chloroflexota bacterium]